MQPIQLSIPKPCHEDWDKMTPNQQGRFCGSCAKTVVDFSAMTDAQMIMYFENLKASANVCGRVYPDQLNRPLEKATPVQSRKKISWLWQYAAALILFFTKGSVAKAQGEIRGKVAVKGDTSNLPQPIRLGGIRRVDIPKEVHVLPAPISQLFITDENNNPVAGASIQLLPSKEWRLTDSAGRINLGKMHAVKEVKISAVGYEDKDVKLKDVKGNSIPLLKNEITLGNVIVTSIENSCSRRLIAGGISIARAEDINSLPETIQPTYSDVSLSVFPNPVQKGKEISFTVTTKKKKDYKILIADANGKIMMQQHYSANKNAQQTNISIPALWSSGVYIISLVDKDEQTIQSEKIMLL